MSPTDRLARKFDLALDIAIPLLAFVVGVVFGFVAWGL